MRRSVFHILRSVYPARALYAVLALSVISCASSPRVVETRPDSSVFVVRIGRDTSAVQWMVREGNRVRMQIVRRIPSVELRRLDVVLDSDGSVASLEELIYALPGGSEGAPPTGRTVITLVGDSTIVETGLGPNTRRQAYAGRGHIIGPPYLIPSYAVVSTYGPAAVGDSIVAQQLAGSFGPRPLVIKRTTPDQVALSSSVMGTIRVRLDRTGRAMAFDGTGSSVNYEGERVGWLSVDSVAQAFVERERIQGSVGAISPRDTATAAIGGATVEVDYGRPSRRGRVIFGGIVPWHRVWRTGANLATHLTTDRPLAFGDTVVPAGRYTLWTLPTPDGWTLIISRQTGQWGTDYDPRHDLLRTPMRVRRIAVPVEQFTIAIEQEEGGGALRLEWDTTEASAAFAVR